MTGFQMLMPSAPAEKARPGCVRARDPSGSDPELSSRILHRVRGSERPAATPGPPAARGPLRLLTVSFKPHALNRAQPHALRDASRSTRRPYETPSL